MPFLVLDLLLGVVVGLILAQLGTLVTTVYLHRALSHRALALHPMARATCRVLTWLSTGIKPREWIAVHRRHHAYTDVPGDPHSPVLDGFAMVQFGNAVLYRRVARDGVTVRRYARDLPPDRWDRAVFDRAFVGLGLGIALLVVVLGPVAGVVAAVVHAGAYLLLNASINAVGHRYGRRPHDNAATNSQWLALLTGGEGLHNNHHHAPTSARLALSRGEIDPGWWVVRGLRGAGLASVRERRTERGKVAPAA